MVRVKRTPLKRRTPLRRKTPLRRQPNALTRRTWVKKQSDKRKAQAVLYRTKRAAFLRAHPRCEVNVTHSPYDIATPRGPRSVDDRNTRSEDVHHVRGRGGTNYLDESTWLATCRACHEFIHTHANAARQRGLLQF